ncbi:MAG: tellurite resistance TerB family protein [Pseudomonadota bacterium]
MTPQDALVALMVTTSAADERMGAPELLSISRMIDGLPVFEDYDEERVRHISEMVFDMLEADDGLDAIVGLAHDALPEQLRETAYALACDVVAADGQANIHELRWLEMLRHRIGVGRLPAAAIERGARARYQRIPEPG